MRAAIAAALVVALFGCTAQPEAGAFQGDANVIAGFATVVDGDGLEIGGAKIRLFGIDAFEAGQYCTRENGTRWRCGHHATVALDRLVAGERVSCVVRDRDRYARLVAVCKVGGRDLAAALAHDGWALAYRKFSTDYVNDEQVAERAKAGAWVGRFEAPWAWRDRMRRAGSESR